MKKAYYLATCDTCRRILKLLDLDDSWTLREIKKEPISAKELAEMRALSGSYEELLNRRAKIYKEMNLKEKSLSEEMIKELILREYTFLKRPVFVLGQNIFIGNSKENIETLVAAIASSQ